MGGQVNKIVKDSLLRTLSTISSQFFFFVFLLFFFFFFFCLCECFFIRCYSTSLHSVPEWNGD